MNQSIEDASEKAFFQWVNENYPNTNHMQSRWQSWKAGCAWQAARQSSQSEPVYQYYDDSSYGWNDCHKEFYDAWHEKKRIVYAAPQQAIPADAVIAAARKTIDENGYLADGDDCTLYDLREALAAYDASPTAPIERDK
jgi:hypothetical protein